MAARRRKPLPIGPHGPAGHRGPSRPLKGSGPSPAHARFLSLDRSRAEREWKRYEGTGQRQLFRLLRERFLVRHSVAGGWAADIGAGPGRFTPLVGGRGARRVALDLSGSMLSFGQALDPPPARGERRVERVRGDALHPPFRPGSFATLALLGNTLGFEVSDGERLLATTEALLGREGTMVVEIAPGPGERSNYLHRLPIGAIHRLFAAPTEVFLPRLLADGFRTEPVRHRAGAFRRWSVEEMAERWRSKGWGVTDVLAVAPALGTEIDRVASLARDPVGWERLIELEEQLGRTPERWPDAASVLLAARRSAAQTI